MIKIYAELLKEREEALAKAEVYREVAIMKIKPEYLGGLSVEDIDAEAQRILSERKSKGVEE